MKSARKPPTMADVAREAGVSPMTVSRAFKSDAYVNDETRRAILLAADRLGYVMDSMASGLSSRKTGFVAVTIPSINNANFADTVRGLTDGLLDKGLQVLLGYTNYSLEEEERLVRQLLTRRPEAIVVTGGKHTGKCRAMLENAGIPVIETWDLPPDPIDSVVGFSNAEASAMIVRHLVSTGRSKIAFLGGDTSRDTRGFDRRRGFVRTMQELKLDATRLAEIGPPPISMREGADALARLMAKWPDTEAVVCVSDLVAYGALTECQRLGIEVPGEMAVAGFGAYEISDICVPPITSVDPHCYQIGLLSAGRILELLSDEEDGKSHRQTVLDPGLLIRASTVSPEKA
ncbi:LacI family DNA-binding transcriptional regulator [Hoeflea ulvae]|uniref:LacI family DNA-binding transcriptional regulator n=1 Tax=Hoeflea ulvae TaxID=2983764 RepID=A0ABT3YM35_9HYPH|nr:LacI family DNA-binding transcriptional regulator [Hoeflea ulvae]MCY0096897.1 LacI family DNA-binding transcriptional regulator [Hoeflea ulvae]